MANANGQISVAERNELRKIVRTRFGLLQAKLRSAELAAKKAVADQLEASVERTRRSYERKQRLLVGRQEKLNEAWEDLKDDAYEDGLVLQPSTGMPDVRAKWVPVDLPKKVEAAYEQIKEQQGTLEIDLYEKELELMEELAIGALAGDAAKAFLASIPTVQQLTPQIGSEPATKVIEAIATVVPEQPRR